MDVGIRFGHIWAIFTCANLLSTQHPTPDSDLLYSRTDTNFEVVRAWPLAKHVHATRANNLLLVPHDHHEAEQEKGPTTNALEFQR